MNKGFAWINLILIALVGVAAFALGSVGMNLWETFTPSQDTGPVVEVSTTTDAQPVDGGTTTPPGVISGATSTVESNFYTQALSNVRDCPSLDCEVVDQVRINSTTTLPYESLADLPEWVKVEIRSESGSTSEGYMHRSVFSDEMTEVPPEPPRQPETAESIPEDANFCGDRYWEACPDKYTFQCQDGRGVCTPKIGTVLERRRVDVRSIVALKCFYEKDDGKRTSVRGSGVFTSSEGHILTNRHVVDQEYAASLGSDLDPSFEFDNCEVRYLPRDTEITEDEVRTTAYPVFDYTTPQHDWTADVLYMPDTEPLSDLEEDRLDYAVLKVQGKNDRKYDDPGEAPEIVPAPVLLPSTIEWQENLVGSDVLVPGYAVQGIYEPYDNPYNFYIFTAKLGEIIKIFGGDRAFKDIVLTAQTEIDTHTEQGRSGSPVFYKGHVIGLHSGIPYRDESKEYLSETALETSISAIVQNLGSKADEVIDETVKFKVAE